MHPGQDLSNSVITLIEAGRPEDRNSFLQRMLKDTTTGQLHVWIHTSHSFRLVEHLYIYIHSYISTSQIIHTYEHPSHSFIYFYFSSTWMNTFFSFIQLFLFVKRIYECIFLINSHIFSFTCKKTYKVYYLCIGYVIEYYYFWRHCCHSELLCEYKVVP